MDSDLRTRLAGDARQGGACGAGGLAVFRRTVLDHYQKHGRDLPWRRTRDPYRVLVSEVMLQQTQVNRVLRKYDHFLFAFPDAPSLARAGVAEILSVWQGLGYNRRALALRGAAQIIVSRHGGAVPPSPAALQDLPGIGAATAAAVCVFAFDQPLAFVETNIRSAFIHFFFQECDSVADAEILPLVALTLDRENPREWYYALMDYGAWVKKAYDNPGRRSRHFAIQAPFAGSRRQARAAILRLLLARAPAVLTAGDVQREAFVAGRDPAEIDGILEELAGEGFLLRVEKGYRVA